MLAIANAQQAPRGPRPQAPPPRPASAPRSRPQAPPPRPASAPAPARKRPAPGPQAPRPWPQSRHFTSYHPRPDVHECGTLMILLGRVPRSLTGGTRRDAMVAQARRAGMPRKVRASAGGIGGRCAIRASSAARSTSSALRATGRPRAKRQRVLHADPQVTPGPERPEHHRQGGPADPGGRPGCAGGQRRHGGGQRGHVARHPARYAHHEVAVHVATGRRPNSASSRCSAATCPRSNSSNSGTT